LGDRLEISAHMLSRRTSVKRIDAFLPGLSKHTLLPRLRIIRPMSNDGQ
jgi:hypothetical protein